jgi:hypothetical protein
LRIEASAFLDALSRGDLEIRYYLDVQTGAAGGWCRDLLLAEFACVPDSRVGTCRKPSVDCGGETIWGEQ